MSDDLTEHLMQEILDNRDAPPEEMNMRMSIAALMVDKIKKLEAAIADIKTEASKMGSVEAVKNIDAIIRGVEAKS